MRIAAISDIHGNVHALRAVLESIDHDAVDVIANLGDLLSGPVAPAQTAELLMASTMISLQGNHERQLLSSATAQLGRIDADTLRELSGAHLQWLAALP